MKPSPSGKIDDLRNDFERLEMGIVKTLKEHLKYGRTSEEILRSLQDLYHIEINKREHMIMELLEHESRA